MHIDMLHKTFKKKTTLFLSTFGAKTVPVLRPPRKLYRSSAFELLLPQYKFPVCYIGRPQKKTLYFSSGKDCFPFRLHNRRLKQKKENGQTVFLSHSFASKLQSAQQALEITGFSPAFQNKLGNRRRKKILKRHRPVGVMKITAYGAVTAAMAKQIP